MFMRTVLFGLYSVSSALLIGCGGVSTTEVTGTVKYRDKPLTTGSITLLASDNNLYIGSIEANGQFSIPKVPVGPVKIAVSSPNPNDVETRGSGASATIGERIGGSRAKPVPAGWVPIPEKYGDPQNSGLTGDAKRGVPLTVVVP